MMSKNALGDIETHFWLSRSVARSMGISLTEAMAEGRISPCDYAEIVTRCRASHCAEQCKIWLAAQQTQAVEAPEFCASAQVLNALKQSSDPGM